MLATIFLAPGRFINAWIAHSRAKREWLKENGLCETCELPLGPDEDGEEHVQCWLDRQV